MALAAKFDAGRSHWKALWARALVLGVAFFILGAFAIEFVFPPYPSAVLWLPSGLSLAVMLRTPPRDWPVLLAVTFVAEFSSVIFVTAGVPLVTAFCWGLGSVLRALFGAWLVRRCVGTSIQLSRGWEVVGLFLFG